MPNYRIDVEINPSRTQQGRRVVSGELSALERQAKRLQTALNSALAFAGISVGVAGLFKMAQSARQFGDAMAEVSTLVDTTVISMDRLTKSALEQAKTFGEPARQAKALYQIISAGAANAAEANETLAAANKLAAGGVTQVEIAADGLTSVMNAYGGAAGTATDISDTFFVGMKAGKTTVEELSKSVGNVAPLAAQLGVSFEELIAATSALTKGGISTSVAMNGIRAIMAAVAKPTSEASKLANKLGIEFSAAGLKAKGMGDFMKELVEKTNGSQEKMALLFGGVEALVPALALAGQAGADMNVIMGQMADKADQTEKAYAKMAESPGFKLNELLGKIQVKAIELGSQLLDHLLPVIIAISENFDTIVTVINAAIIVFGTYATVTAVATAATVAMSGSFGIAIGFIGTLGTEFGVLAAAEGVATAATGGFSAALNVLTAAMAANPIGVVAIGIAALAGGLYFITRKTQEATKATEAQAQAQRTMERITKDVAKETLNLASATGKAREESLKNIETLKAEAERYLAVAAAAAIAASAKALEAAQKAKEEINKGSNYGTDQGRRGTYRAQQAIAEADRAAAAADEAGKSWREWMGKVGELQAQIEKAINPISAAGGAVGDLSDTTDKAAKAAESARDSYKDFIANLKFDTSSLGKTADEAKGLEITAKAADAAAAGFRDLAMQIAVTGAAYLAAKNAQNAADFVKTLVDETKQIGKNEKQTRMMAVALELEKAKSDASKKSIQDASDAREAAYSEKALKDFNDNVITPLEHELELLELSGQAAVLAAKGQTSAARALERQHKVAELQLSKEAKQAEWLAQGLGDVDKKWEEYYNWKLKIINTDSAIQQDVDEVRKLNQELSDTLNALSSMGGAAGGLSKVIDGIMAGDFSNFGAAGGLINLALRGSQDYKKQAEIIGSRIEEVFGVGKPFANMMANVVQGASTGAMVGSVVFGADSKQAQIGSMAGGALGQALGTGLSGTGELLSFLGGAAGPIGAIAGSLLGGLLGKALTPTQRGSATFNNNGQVSSRGNSSDRIAASGDLGDAILNSFSKIADAFDATLGDFKFSVGMRENNYRYDPTGQGITKTQNGAINFGQNQQALLEHAIRDALAKGVFEGLSEGVKRILNNTEGGNLETQLQKALSFQNVFSDLTAIKNPLGVDLTELDKWKSSMDDIFKEAGASAEQVAQLEELYAIRRKDAVEEANKAILEKERSRRELEIELMRVQGKSAEALAAARQLEIEGMTAEEAAIQKQINRWQDVHEQNAKDHALAEKQLALNDKLLELSGKTEVLRRNELKAMEESLRPLQERVWAMEDEKRLSESRQSITLDILDLTDSEDALRMRRQLEIEAIDSSLKSLLERKFALEDEAAAAQNLANKVRAISLERYGLETQLYQILGDTQTLRQRELEALDPTNRALQSYIYQIEDQQAATEKASQAASAMAQELQSTAERFTGLADQIREYRATLVANNNAPGEINAKYSMVASAAARGDVKALEGFTATAQAYLENAKDTVATDLEYRMKVAQVAIAADAAIGGADSAAKSALRQIELMQSQVSAIAAVNVSTDAINEALAELEKTQKNEIAPDLEMTFNEGFMTLADAIHEVRDEIKTLRTDVKSGQTIMAGITAEIRGRLNDWDRGDAVGISNEAEEPIYTSAAA